MLKLQLCFRALKKKGVADINNRLIYRLASTNRLTIYEMSTGLTHTVTPLTYNERSLQLTCKYSR